MFRRAGWVGLVVFGVGCRAVPVYPPELKQALQESRGAYLTGEVAALEQEALLHDRDFVYTLALSPDARRAAYTRLGGKHFELDVWSLAESRTLSHVEVNPNAFDVEAVDFSPDGAVVLAASRDGVVRFYAAQDGALRAELATGAPLVSAAFHPDGQHVALGSADGEVSLLEYPALRTVASVRAHQGEVRGLAFSPDGVLYSGGWDKRVAAFDTAVQTVTLREADLRVERKDGLPRVRAQLEGKGAGTWAVDGRAPAVVVGTSLARAAGIEVERLTQTAKLPTALGELSAPVATGRVLSFGPLTLEGVDLAVCDACLPPGVDGVLGAPFAERVELTLDATANRARLLLRPPATPAVREARGLRFQRAQTFPWHVNDLTVDREGKVLGVAFSAAPAERTLEVYRREKRGEQAPLNEGNAGALVSAATFEVVQKWAAHRGVVSTAAVSPDGQALATGGWDKRLLVFRQGHEAAVEARDFGWSVRRVRFSADGRLLGVAAWTPQNPLGDQRSQPSAMLYEVRYRAPQLVRVAQ